MNNLKFIFFVIPQIIIKNTNIVDTSNVDVSYSYYDKNDTFKIIIGYDRRRFTYTNNNNVITITGIGDLSSGLSIKTPSSETILNSDGTINKCNNKWYLFSNKLDCYKCNNIDYNTILTIKQDYCVPEKCINNYTLNSDNTNCIKIQNNTTS